MNLSFLQPVYRRAGPFTSVYLNVSRDAEDAAHAIEVRWRKAREDLAQQGADEATLRAVDGVIGRGEGRPGPTGQVVFATDTEVVFDLLTTHPPQDYVARVGPLPDAMPFLARRGQQVPYVLVLVDSVGADIRAVDTAGTLHTARVEGDEHPTHKPRAGGEHHKQMQRAVDEQVRHNAAKVANEVQHRAVGGGAHVIMLAGDVEARRALGEQLADGVQAKVVESDAGSRAAGSERSPLETELAETLTSEADKRIRTVTDRYEQERGHADRATEGFAATVRALQRAQVEIVFWSPENASGDEEVWIGPQPEQVGLSEEELRDMGVKEPVRERVDAALVRAAAGTSADLVFPSNEHVQLSGGVGALLRFA